MEYFFDRGIRFECLNCGACCTGEPGYVFVDERESIEISSFLGITKEVFVERFLYRVNDAYSIRECEDGRCLFYENGCSIYPVRPMQCRTWPFWLENMRSHKLWQCVAGQCPGIGKGHRYSREEILEIIESSPL